MPSSVSEPFCDIRGLWNESKKKSIPETDYMGRRWKEGASFEQSADAGYVRRPSFASQSFPIGYPSDEDLQETVDKVHKFKNTPYEHPIGYKFLTYMESLRKIENKFAANQFEIKDLKLNAMDPDPWEPGAVYVSPEIEQVGHGDGSLSEMDLMGYARSARKICLWLNGNAGSIQNWANTVEHDRKERQEKSSEFMRVINHLLEENSPR